MSDRRFSQLCDGNRGFGWLYRLSASTCAYYADPSTFFHLGHISFLYFSIGCESDRFCSFTFEYTIGYRAYSATHANLYTGSRAFYAYQRPDRANAVRAGAYQQGQDI